MELTTWFIYFGVVLGLISFPGPSALLCVSHGLHHGKTKAFSTALGGAVAAFCLMSLSSLGLGALLAASESVFLFVKFIGAAFLIYFGICTWRGRSQSIGTIDDSCRLPNDMSKLSLFKSGFLVGISNPKDLLFFAALFPSFININQPQTYQFIILAVTWLVLDVLIMYLYACMGTKISPWFSSALNMHRFNKAAGGIFIMAGGVLAMSSTNKL